jgi:AhpD family alkylhydroperoxidase
MALGGAGAKTRHPDAKTRELIALAVAITLRCDGCITVHTAAAKKLGATKDEIAEALGSVSASMPVRPWFTQPARSTRSMRRRKATGLDVVALITGCPVWSRARASNHRQDPDDLRQQAKRTNRKIAKSSPVGCNGAC